MLLYSHCVVWLCRSSVKFLLQTVNRIFSFLPRYAHKNVTPPTHRSAPPILGGWKAPAVLKGILHHARRCAETAPTCQPEGKQSFRYCRTMYVVIDLTVFVDGELLPSGTLEELYREVSAQTIRNLPSPPADASQDGVRYD